MCSRSNASTIASRPQAFAAAATAAMTFKNFAHSSHKREPLTRQMCADFRPPTTPNRLTNVGNLSDALPSDISADFFPENVYTSPKHYRGIEIDADWLRAALPRRGPAGAGRSPARLRVWGPRTAGEKAASRPLLKIGVCRLGRRDVSPVQRQNGAAAHTRRYLILARRNSRIGYII